MSSFPLLGVLFICFTINRLCARDIPKVSAYFRLVDKYFLHSISFLDCGQTKHPKFLHVVRAYSLQNSRTVLYRSSRTRNLLIISEYN